MMIGIPKRKPDVTLTLTFRSFVNLKFIAKARSLPIQLRGIYMPFYLFIFFLKKKKKKL
jgi:hypothetical protein